MGPLAASTDDRLIWDTWLAAYRLPALTAADAIGTFSALASQSMTTEHLAGVLRVDARALGIHLGLLAALGFVERHEGKWNASAQSRTWLLPENEGYCGPVLRSFHDLYPLHAQLVATLRRQTDVQAHPSAAAEWERGEMPTELAHFLTGYMNAHSCAAAKAVARQSLFAGVASVLDVGGGSAVFSIELARAQPNLHATVLEIAAVCSEADGFIARSGLQSRVTTTACNMFTQPWPAGFEIHFLSNIFHDWSVDTCGMLARKSFEALRPGGHIVLHEMLMNDDGCGPLPAAAFSLLMLLTTRGKQYCHTELREILEGVGFVNVQSFTTGGGYYSLVTARKP